jgi:hypothetical protein
MRADFWLVILKTHISKLSNVWAFVSTINVEKSRAYLNIKFLCNRLF